EGSEFLQRMPLLRQQQLPLLGLFGGGGFDRVKHREELIEPVELGDELVLPGSFSGRPAESCGEIIPGTAGEAFLEALPGLGRLAIASQDSGEEWQGRMLAREGGPFESDSGV